ncbi:unnamed protein product [Prorocentrum cordatum]|uniref:Uncharacterized protein n=1 Tax=Prorocentrum cordatum TaxID=2364126 RepID=A0ABN9Q8I0_9DINO|nr:unnamed protein product [Polarella glacialis]
MLTHHAQPLPLGPAHVECEPCLLQCAIPVGQDWAMREAGGVIGGSRGRFARASATLAILALLCCAVATGLVCTRGAASVGSGDANHMSLAGLDISSSSSNASIDGDIRIQIWLLLPRPDFDKGLLLYHPALVSFKDGFTAMGANVSIVGRSDFELIKAHLASTSALSESHWIVIFPHDGEDASWLQLQECRKRGARLVVFNTEPGYPGQPQSITQLVSYLGAAEIWEYSQKNLLYYHSTTPAIVRYVPPHYTHSLDYGIDLHGGPVQKMNSTCVLQTKSTRDSTIMDAVSEFFQGSLQELEVNPANATLSTMRNAFIDCAIGLNLHALGGDLSVGQMESFRMALFLSNKMCVVSEGLDPVEMPIWDGLVQTPGVWKPDMESRLAGLKQVADSCSYKSSGRTP